jgi:ABC-type amino acid transport substrate-binding protein
MFLEPTVRTSTPRILPMRYPNGIPPTRYAPKIHIALSITHPPLLGVILAYESFESLAGKTIAVLENTASETLLKDYVKSTAPTLTVHPCADYYSMRVMLRAGTVDGACLPRTVAASWHESRTMILPFEIGALPYYAIAKKDSVLLDLCNEVFYDWRLNGTFSEWAREFGVEWGANG